MRTVDAYATSAADLISRTHLPPRLRGIPAHSQDSVVALAERVWADLTAEDGQIRLTLDHVRKMWALSRPDFTQPGSGLDRPATVLFMDEAQDTPPVLEKVIADQTLRKVIVGDQDQAIYGFTGAVDFLATAAADVELPLTKSWRFGPEVADIGNRFLELLGSGKRIEGGGPASRITEAHAMSDADAILVRSNAGAIAEIIRELDAGRTVGVPKGTKSDLVALVETARYLQGRGRAPWRLHEDLAPYRTWDEVLDEATKGDDPKLAMLVRIVDQHGIDGLATLVRQVHEPQDDAQAQEKLAGMFRDTGTELVTEGNAYGFRDALRAAGFEYRRHPDGGIVQRGKNKGQPVMAWLATGTPEERKLAQARALELLAQPPDVFVSTAHKAKGLEWDRVRIGGDFKGPQPDPDTGEPVMPAPEELRLAYVAVTRAQKELDPGSLAYVYEHTSPNGGTITTAPPAPTVNTAPARQPDAATSPATATDVTGDTNHSAAVDDRAPTAHTDALTAEEPSPGDTATTPTPPATDAASRAVAAHLAAFEKAVQRHFASPPHTWSSRKRSGKWDVVDSQGNALTTEKTKKAAQAQIDSGWLSKLWHENNDWYLGRSTNPRHRPLTAAEQEIVARIHAGTTPTPAQKPDSSPAGAGTAPGTTEPNSAHTADSNTARQVTGEVDRPRVEAGLVKKSLTRRLQEWAEQTGHHFTTGYENDRGGRLTYLIDGQELTSTQLRRFMDTDVLEWPPTAAAESTPTTPGDLPAPVSISPLEPTVPTGSSAQLLPPDAAAEPAGTQAPTQPASGQELVLGLPEPYGQVYPDDLIELVAAGHDNGWRTRFLWQHALDRPAQRLPIRFVSGAGDDFTVIRVTWVRTDDGAYVFNADEAKIKRSDDQEPLSGFGFADILRALGHLDPVGVEAARRGLPMTGEDIATRASADVTLQRLAELGYPDLYRAFAPLVAHQAVTAALTEQQIPPGSIDTATMARTVAAQAFLEAFPHPDAADVKDFYPAFEKFAPDIHDVPSDEDGVRYEINLMVGDRPFSVLVPHDAADGYEVIYHPTAEEHAHTATESDTFATGLAAEQIMPSIRDFAAEATEEYAAWLGPQLVGAEIEKLSEVGRAHGWSRATEATEQGGTSRSLDPADTHR
jgi:hypothetical protein